MVKEILDNFFYLFERIGLHVLPVHYYSPIPDTRTLKKKPEIWTKELPLLGINLNLEGQEKLVKQIHELYHLEYMDFPVEKTNGSQYYLSNGSFGYSSGQMLYGMIRYFKPKNMIEVGNGNSTLAALAAIRKNKADGHNCEYTTIDPYPPAFLKKDQVGIDHFIVKKVEDVDPSIFDQLSENDILFIDSSHTVKTGGDVNFLILEVLPRLKNGAIVHIHDIQFPYEYFESYVMQKHWFWQEQYLIQAFLMYNDSFKILWCASYMHYKRPDTMKKYFSAYPKERVPTSLYIQKL